MKFHAFYNLRFLCILTSHDQHDDELLYIALTHPCMVRNVRRTVSKSWIPSLNCVSLYDILIPCFTDTRFSYPVYYALLILSY